MSNKTFATAILAGSALLLTAGIASAQSVVNLTAARQSTLLPNGANVPMWGWVCGNPAATTAGGTGTPAPTGGATCTQTNGTPQSLGTTTTSPTWQPPLITVPYTNTAGVSTTALTITLTNALPVATSLTIVGQLPSGDVNGLGNPTREAGPRTDGAHQGQTATTWTTVVTSQAPFTPPTQGNRARAFVQEALAAGSVTYTWSALRPGTYLIETGTYPSIQGPMGLYGVLVVAVPATASAAGTAYPAPAGATVANAAGLPYDADAVVLLSEIDAAQNGAVAAIFPGGVANAGFTETAKWTYACSTTGPAATANTCYPPAVDYTPTYYLINGHSFDRTNPGASAVTPGVTSCTAASPPVCTTATPYFAGNVLLRYVNAGSHMHLPSVVGLQTALIAEDGNLQPDVSVGMTKPAHATCPSGMLPIAGACPKVQADWFMAAGKVLDLMVQPAHTTTYAATYYPTFDRQLSLSANAIERDAGMQALVALNAGTRTVNATTGVTTLSGITLAAGLTATTAANPDNYIVPHGATTFSGNVLANDVGVHNASSPCTAGGSTAPQAITAGGAGSGTLNPDGSFTLTAIPATFTNGATATFSYCGNGQAAISATVTLTAAVVGGVPHAINDSYTSPTAKLLTVSAGQGVLANDSDPSGYPLTAVPVGGTIGAPSNTITAGSLTVVLNANGSFYAQAGVAGTYTFQYNAVNAQGTSSSAPATVTLVFPAASNLNLQVKDANTGGLIQDYKWVIEQDLTFKIDPKCQVNNGAGGAVPAGCPPLAASGVPPTLGTTFHTSYMPVIAAGCTGVQSCERGQSVYDNSPTSPTFQQHVPAVCIAGVCTPSNAGQVPASLPSAVHLAAFEPDGVTPARYYISVLPGDISNPFNAGFSGAVTPACAILTGSTTTPTGQAITQCGHAMGGAPIPPPTCTGTGATLNCTFAAGPGSAATPVVVNLQPNPLQTATLTIFVFEDDAPLNGEHDAGGNNREPGLGQFQVEIWDAAGSSGDFTGQMEHDIFNMPLSNSLNGTVDPLTGHNACPIAPTAADSNGIANQVALGRIVVCPQYEDDGLTPSPLVGQAIVRNLMPGRFGVVVHPSAAREAAGEEWIQTNTLDGGHALDAFVRSGEPAYFQEFGPGGWHVFMGMVNPAIVNARKASFCNGPPAVPCANTINGHVSNLHMSRAPNETLFDSAVFPLGDPRNNQAFAHTTCWASLGDRDGDTFAFTKCDANGNFTFTAVPDGNWALVVGDQWLDLIIDGSSKPVNVSGGQTLNFDSPVFTWQTHIWTNAFMDLNGNGIQDDPVLEPGLIQVPNRVRFRNGKFSNTQFSNSSGHANFNETFPLFSWFVVETDNTRFKSTGVHTVYDAGGQIDGPGPSGNGRTGAYQGLLNSTETAALAVPSALRVPGAHYCSSADCSELTGVAGFPAAGGPGGSTGRIDPGSVVTEGVQGFISQTEVIEWGKLPYDLNENGGIRGHVVYSSTRPFDDPQLLFQNLWEPLVPGVTINLYQEKLAADGTMGLTLVDQTKTSSWDAFAQGFRAANVPNLNCPGQDPADPFFPYTLAGTTNFLTPGSTIPNNSQFKCYDGMHNFNQVQPAPYDGLYQFPSQACSGTATSFTATINGTAVTVTCATVANTNAGHPGSTAKILPPGKYVVEVVVPPGYELTKEEDKNILMGDNWVASATIGAQFVGLGDIFIVPDQAAVNAQNASYTGPFTGAGNPYNPNGTGGVPNQNNSQPTADMGNSTLGSFGPGGLIQMPAPCVGQLRVVPDFMTISPEGGEVAPFAGALRRLCDRKEINLEDQMQSVADFFVWTKTPASTHYTGFILDDFSSEFDQASPGFGEKFAVPNLPVSIKDFNGVEISRTMSDQWGLYNGVVFSSFDVNPPNPTGYSPGMMVTCMNDPGPVIDTRTACTTAPTGTSPGAPAGCSTTTGQLINDPFFNPAYSTFCYENPFMPADTTYLDTPVVPVSAFAEAYNPPDCAYPDATPSIKSVTGTTGLSINAASGSKACSSAAACSGPWVTATGQAITITALGDVTVPNHAYSGPAATTAPYNQKFIQRHYGFGAGAQVTIGGQPATCSGGDLTMTCTVPTTLPPCAHQQAGTGNGGARCGELVITTATGQKSVDTVTVVAGGKRPTFINGENASGNAIQSALNAATPGDEIIVGPGTYRELLLMWKPVRLQGVAAASVIVDANANAPSGKAIDAWRRTVNCLFGVSLSGALINGDPTATPPTPPAPYDPTGTYSCNFALSNGQAVADPIPLEPIIGWNANLNGNLSELLQEPTLLGAYEGAGITVLAKGLENNNTANCFSEGSAGCIPLNSSVAAGGDCNPSSPFFPTNYLCNPARIDAITFSDSSQGGGGILLHGWSHNTEVSNNRVTNNAGTLTGGVTIGQAEVPDPTLGGVVCPALAGFPAPSATDAAPLCIDANVNMHNNNVSLNASYGDELNSTTPSAGGGVTFTPGSDNYRFTNNWVCGNLSSGDGGGFSHYGLSFNGTIAHNSFLFNQSNNPTLTTWGGGIVVEGASPDGTASENSLIDVDVAPSLSDGSGPLTIDSNLIMGNTAESGSGGGLRIELANGNDILNNPSAPSHWYAINVTNNIIANNVAGWAGGGVSIQDAVKVSLTNNTVTSNDATASAGVLFDTLGAPNSNVPPPGCNPTTNAGCTNPVTLSNFQPAGLETHKHSLNLIPAFTVPGVVCPAGHPNCTAVSIPALDHDYFWQNRSFHITTAGTPAVVTLTPPLNQAGHTGACPGGANYWDLGVYGDTSQTPNSGSGYSLSPTNSTITTGYAGGGNTNGNPGFTPQYCNGSRVTPEIASVVCTASGANPNGNANAPGCIRPGALGITTPPGIPDNNPFYENFTLTPAATVDEGNNWINMFYGPLSKVNPSIQKGSAGYNAPLGGYRTPSGPSVP